MRRAGHRVVEVNRGDRRTRRSAGKSDTIDAEVAARSVLAGQSTAIPKTADGAVEMMRQVKITRDTAVKARTTAMNTLKQIVAHASPVLREALHDLTDHGLLTRCARLRPGPLDTPTASAKHALRALARRWMALTEEIAIHDQHLARLTAKTSSTLREDFGVGAHTAAELLIIFGDNPDRIRSEAAFAKLCGTCPIPVSSGMTTGRHRLNRGGHRHANAWLQADGIAAFNRRFAVPAAQAGTAFVPPPTGLERVFTIQHERTVSNANTVQFHRRVLQIGATPLRCHFVRCRVTVHEHLDETLSITYGPHTIARFTRDGEPVAITAAA